MKSLPPIQKILDLITKPRSPHIRSKGDLNQRSILKNTILNLNTRKNSIANLEENHQNPACFKCGKVGHYANKCYTKKKLNEIQMDEGLNYN